MWTSKEWTGWGNAFKAYYDGHGSRLTKFVISEALEGALIRAGMETNPHGVKITENGGISLVDVPVAFKRMRVLDMCLFVSEYAGRPDVDVDFHVGSGR